MVTPAWKNVVKKTDDVGKTARHSTLTVQNQIVTKGMDAPDVVMFIDNDVQSERVAPWYVLVADNNLEDYMDQ